MADVLLRWRTSGPLVHLPTCFSSLNDATGGGPVYGSRWYVLGAPDASKTLLLVQLGHMWAEEGVTVGFLAVDEEDEDLVTRLVQRSERGGTGEHFRRADCEARTPAALDAMQARLAGCQVVFYGPESTIEQAADDLAALASERGTRAVLMVDSIQTAECDAARSTGLERSSKSKDVSVREKITENSRAIRACATKHKMLVIATSEMNRAAYKAIGKVEQNDMAAAKESGAIEYSARVMIALRNVSEEPNCIEARVIKNKHGSSYPHLEPFYLKIDRAKQWLIEREPPEANESLIDLAVEIVMANSAGITTESIRKHLGKRREAIESALSSASASGLVRRLNGPKSPWVPGHAASIPDPDSDEFP